MTNPRIRHLRVKIKSLAAESRFIRCEESRALTHPPEDKYGTGYNPDYEELRMHRKDVVGHEARHSLLAYACLRGVPYKVVEPKVRSDNLPNWEKVRELALRFGGKADEVDVWVIEAAQYIKHCAQKEAA